MPAIHHIPDCERIPAMYQKIPATYYTKLCEKKRHSFGFVWNTFFVFWNPLQIFVPRIDILFLGDNYFMVFIF